MSKDKNFDLFNESQRINELIGKVTPSHLSKIAGEETMVANIVYVYIALLFSRKEIQIDETEGGIKLSCLDYTYNNANIPELQKLNISRLKTKVVELKKLPTNVQDFLVDMLTDKLSQQGKIYTHKDELNMAYKAYQEYQIYDPDIFKNAIETINHELGNQIRITEILLCFGLATLNPSMIQAALNVLQQISDNGYSVEKPVTIGYARKEDSSTSYYHDVKVRVPMWETMTTGNSLVPALKKEKVSDPHLLRYIFELTLRTETEYAAFFLEEVPLMADHTETSEYM